MQESKRQWGGSTDNEEGPLGSQGPEVDHFPSAFHEVQVVERVEEPPAGLMDGADHTAAQGSQGTAQV